MSIFKQISPRTNSLNNSPTKQSYSFSKNERFQNFKANCSQDFYNMPSFKVQRSPGFGLGKKTDFSKQTTNVPGPGSYKYTSIFQQQKGTSFGAGREELKLSGIYQKPQGPSLINYKLPSSFNKISYSFGSKLNQQYSQTPGPGSYNILNAISPKGNYFLSNLQNSRAPTFSSPKSNRFSHYVSNNPGPCSYKPKTDLQLGGKYVVSNQPSVLSYSLPKSNRNYYPKTTIQETPGPGSYKVYSEF